MAAAPSSPPACSCPRSPRPPPPIEAAAVRLEGSLDAFSLPDIFALLSMTKKTGGLHLRRPGAHGVVWFTTGGLTGGASDVARQSLARRVVGRGQVDDDALAAAVERAGAEEGVGVVRALQQSGAVDEGALHDLVGEHVIDTVFDLLRWPEGDFAFVIDEPNPDDVGVSRVAEDVVSEARRRLEVWGTVATAIPNADTVLALTPNPADDPTLSREEWALLALVDGRRSVAQVVALAGRGELAVVSTLADLVSRGLLRADDAGDVAALVRRHELLARLESAPALETAPAALAPVESDDDEDEDDDEPAVAEVTKLPRPSTADAPPARRS